MTRRHSSSDKPPATARPASSRRHAATAHPAHSHPPATIAPLTVPPLQHTPTRPRRPTATPHAHRWALGNKEIQIYNRWTRGMRVTKNSREKLANSYLKSLRNGRWEGGSPRRRDNRHPSGRTLFPSRRDVGEISRRDDGEMRQLENEQAIIREKGIHRTIISFSQCLPMHTSNLGFSIGKYHELTRNVHLSVICH